MVKPFLYIGLLLLSALAKTQSNPNQPVIRTLWSRADTTYNEYRIPSLIVSKDNTLLAFAEGRDGGDTGNIDLLLRRSTDNGLTWSVPLIVWDDMDNTCGNPCPVVDQETGRIVLLMTWNLGSDHESDIIRKRSKGSRQVYLTYSDDDGLTWSDPQNITSSTKSDQWEWYATGPGVGIQLKSKSFAGRLVIPANHSYDNPKISNRDGFGYGAHVLLSDDGGVSWRMSEPIIPEVNESQVVELPDGTLIMNMRSYHGKKRRALAMSKDGGETWSDISHDPQLVEPVCQASIINYGLVGDQNLLLFSNPADSTDRTHMTIKSSMDNGQNWSDGRLIYAGPSAYSSLSRLPDGNIGLFFEMGDNNPYENMVFISLDPADLSAAETVIK